MSTGHDYLKTIKAAKDAAAKLMDVDRDLRDRHAILLAEHKRVTSALRPLAETIENMERLVDATAARWAADHAWQVARAFSGHTDVNVSHTGMVYRRPRLPRFEGRPFDLAELCGLAPEATKTRLRVVLQSVPTERYGLSAEDRAAKLADLDRQIAAIEASHTALVAAAGDVGIALDLLPTAAKDKTSAIERAADLEAERQATAM